MASANNIYGNSWPPPLLTLEKQQQGVPRILPQQAAQQAAQPAAMSLVNRMRLSPAYASLTENQKTKLKISGGRGRSCRGSKRAKRNRSKRNRSRRSRRN